MDNASPVKKRYIWLALIFLTAALLRLPSLLTTFVNIDENEYSIAALKILNGGLPYKDFLIYQPPLVYYFYALSFKLFGIYNFIGVHILLIALVTVTVYFIYLAAKEAFSSDRAGLLAAIFYAGASVIFLPQDMLAANCEILSVLPLSIGAWFYFVAERRLKDSPLFLAGMFAGIAALTKYQCGIVIVPMFLALLLRKKPIAAIYLIFGFLFPVAVAVFLFWRAGAWNEAFDLWLYITRYAKGPPQGDALYVLIKFAIRTLFMAIAASGVWFFGFKGAAQNTFKRPFLILWLLFSFVPVIVGGRMYFHYYFVVLLPLCVLAAGSIVEKGISVPMKWIFLTMGLCATVATFTYAAYKPFQVPTVREDWKYVVDYFHDNAAPNDSLFIWGYCPQIYVLSGLRPVTRFTTADYLTGKTPATAGMEYDPNTPNPPSSWQKVLNDFRDPPGIVIFDTKANVFPKAWGYLKEDFARELPTYIIDTAPSNYRRYARYPVDNYPFLKETLDKNYKFVVDVKGYRIYKERGK